MTRKSDVPCPVCSEPLMQPDFANDHPDWDCFGCGLEIPDSFHVDGRDVVEALRDPSNRAGIVAVLPEWLVERLVDILEKPENE